MTVRVGQGARREVRRDVGVARHDAELRGRAAGGAEAGGRSARSCRLEAGSLRTSGARAARRPRVPRRVRLQLHDAARHARSGAEPDDAPDLQLRDAGGHPRRGRHGSSAWWRPTTSAARSTRGCAPSRWRAACTWGSATRSPRTSRRPTAGPTRCCCATSASCAAKHMPEVDVILIEVPDEVGGYGAKGVGEIGCVATAGAVAGALHSYDGIRRFRLPMDGCAGGGAVGAEVAEDGTRAPRKRSAQRDDARALRRPRARRDGYAQRAQGERRGRCSESTLSLRSTRAACDAGPGQAGDRENERPILRGSPVARSLDRTPDPAATRRPRRARCVTARGTRAPSC